MKIPGASKVGLMPGPVHDVTMSRDKCRQKNLNGIGNSDKLKNPTAPSSEEFFSLSTGAAEILIFVVLRVPLKFFISRDIVTSCMSPY
jgi:hypothetical protein